MSYQVIARKYRPQRFSDVVGQEHVTQTLGNAVRTGRIAHAYIFCGPRGTGKTTLARIFAKCLNCTGGPKVDFDDGDPRVREITEGRSLDVLEIDGASNNGVEQVRELRDTVKFAPAASTYKIYIIDEVHMLSTAAFNALLKTLEEPPAHVKFLFATTDPEKVLPTILSRCQRFDLRRIPAAQIASHLGEIARKEGVSIDEPALHAIARGADGGMRDAQSTLDQLISFCGDRVVEDDVLSVFGLTGRAQLLDLTDALVAGDEAAALRLVDRLAKGGKDLGRLLGDLLGHCRNLLLHRVTGGDRALIDVTDVEWAALERQAAGIDSEALTRVVDVLTTAEGRQRDAGSRRIFLEVTLLRAIQARNAVSLNAVLHQLRELREGAPVPPGPAPAAPRTEPARTDPPAATSPVPGDAPAAPRPAAAPPPPAPAAPAAPLAPAAEPPLSLEALWPRLLALLGPSDGFLKSHLEQATPRELSADRLTIACPPEELDLAATPRNVASLTARLAELGLSGMEVRFVAGAARTDTAPAPDPGPAPARPTRPTPPAAPAAAPAPVTLDKEVFLNDPLIREALEIFKGRIVEVHPPGSGNAAD